MDKKLNTEYILFSTVYVVLMRRFGSEDNHSYIAGVYDDFDKAFHAGMREYDWRGGGKYSAEIIRTSLNADATCKNKKDTSKVIMKCEDFEIARKEYKERLQKDGREEI